MPILQIDLFSALPIEESPPPKKHDSFPFFPSSSFFLPACNVMMPSPSSAASFRKSCYIGLSTPPIPIPSIPPAADFRETSLPAGGGGGEGKHGLCYAMLCCCCLYAEEKHSRYQSSAAGERKCTKRQKRYGEDELPVLPRSGVACNRGKERM